MRWRTLGTLFTRDRILFAFGLAGVTYEAVFQAAEHPTLLILFAGCLGFPVFLRADEAKKTKPDEPEEAVK